MMSLKVMLLVASLASQCWTAPQRRNWTPQAILYLKGAQGHRSALERHSRGEEEPDVLQLGASNKSRSVMNELPCLERRPVGGGGLRSSAVSLLLLELLQRAVEEGGGRDDQNLNLENV